MALIDRVKERTGTDLGDQELQAMIDAISAVIDDRFGPSGPTTVFLGDPLDRDGWRHTLRLPSVVDQGQPIEVVEMQPGNSGEAAAETMLTADDYRILHTGRTLQRLTGGPNGKTYWAPMVRITFTPREAAGMRDEAVIRIMQLDTAGQAAAGLKSERAGDYSWTAATGTERAEAREAIFTWLGTALRGTAMPMA
ncbi:hypothetical protein [Nitratireductor soli]|uniref:hypothetical protein n=1 Tax=Nitratireductor soli TaxID=1670619 RepID=UPI00065E1EB0|nr:hypothetical protein [Nitratireductor soli]